jgi:hypothetical protein
MTTEKIQAAIRQLETLRDLPLEERKVRLAELKEKFRLDGVYDAGTDSNATDTENSAVSEELNAVRVHLEPLGLAPEGTPIPELARLAALKITKQ